MDKISYIQIGNSTPIPIAVDSDNIDIDGTSLPDVLDGKEDKVNKVTEITQNSTDVQYPSAKCMYDIIGEIGQVLDRINGEVI